MTSGRAPVLHTNALPVFHIKHCWVFVLIVFFVQRSHFYPLSWSGDNVILPGLLNPLARPEDAEQEAGDEGGGEAAGPDDGGFQRREVSEQRGHGAEQGPAVVTGGNGGGLGGHTAAVHRPCRFCCCCCWRLLAASGGRRQEQEEEEEREGGREQQRQPRMINTQDSSILPLSNCPQLQCCRHIVPGPLWCSWCPSPTVEDPRWARG